MQQVVINGTSSGCWEIKDSVPPGSTILGHLFEIYINYFHLDCKNVVKILLGCKNFTFC